MSNEFHQCHFCGEYVDEGLDSKGNRHWLSDCRPDLVEHEQGPACTWSHEEAPGNCYAYQNRDTRGWSEDHVHFYTDGPM